MRRLFEFKLGIIPLGIYLPLSVVTGLVMASGALPKDMLGAIPVMMLLGFALAELGKRLPVMKYLGGPAILAIFVPSYLVASGGMPSAALEAITTFMKSTNFLYVNIAVIVVGSILGMSRTVLIQGFLRMFVPLLVGSMAAVVVGVGVGMALGIGAYRSFFFIVVPITAGGIGEGAIPLSIAYAEILGASQEEFFGQIVPPVMLGSLTAIILAGLLKRLGEVRPQYSGQGALVRTRNEVLEHKAHEDRPLDLAQMGAGACTALGFYLFGLYAGKLIGMPGPIVMILTAALVKALGWMPREVEEGAYMMYRFFMVIVTFPLLVGVGAVLTPWNDIVAALNVAYFATIVATVCAMTASGFITAKALNMYPVETAIVTACHSGQGGSGDLAILTAADRMVLMPFAQVSTRIGGAAMVVLATILLRWLQQG